jgi:hypothetical protein
MTLRGVAAPSASEGYKCESPAKGESAGSDWGAIAGWWSAPGVGSTVIDGCGFAMRGWLIFIKHFSIEVVLSSAGTFSGRGFEMRSKYKHTGNAGFVNRRARTARRLDQ